MFDNKDKKDMVSGLPLTVHLSNVMKIPANIQKNIEFLFVLKGELNTVINNQHYKLTEADVVLINNGDIYEIQGVKENLVLFMQVDYEFFSQASKKEQSLYLCNSSLNKNEKYDTIRKILAKIMYEYSNREDNYELQIMSLLYRLIYLLNLNFLIADSQENYLTDVQNNKYNERMNNILVYIKQNYNQQISLHDVANSQYLTPEYLSKFFKAQMGITFSKYLNRFRLAQAVKELIRTDHSVTKIAMNNGFPNLVAFNKSFKEEYNTTPAEYRNQIRKKQSVTEESENIYSEIIQVEYEKAAEQLTKYVAADEELNNRLPQQDSVIKRDIIVDINADKAGQTNHSWKNLINLGYAPDGLRSDMQQHLIDIQSTIKFKYARFQGVFSDEMLIDGEQQQEEESNYNFNKIDKLIDFLYSIGLKPFIELGNKAKVLNIASDKIMYFKSASRKRRTGKEYLDRLEKFIIHCVNRYGIGEVSQWYFEIWKEGEKQYSFWEGSFDKYMEIFLNYYRVIKQIVPNAKVGGPGLNPEMNIKWVPKLLEQWEKSGVIPDFFSIYLYPYDVIEDKKANSDSNLPRLLPSRDRNYTTMYLNAVRKMLKTSGIVIPEIHVTEWNCSVSHRQPANDTTFKGAYIVKNIVDTLDAAKSFGYWFCSDISGELKDSKTLLYGDMGLISANGIRKPGFYAYQMLASLGSTLIKKGDGYIITSKSLYNYEIITYNYKHFDYMYCLNEETSVSLDKYYSIFEDQQNLQLNIILKGIRTGRYRIKKYTLNREHGSIFDEWLKMNAIYNLRKAEIDYLKQICVPQQTIFYIESAEELKIESLLEPHEVNLFEITFEYN
ncbi:helix-turn-helix domain-containing protein [Clostridium sp. SYSU_GA19001]|uniref:GH39 family glycosyl hydrolase n=1 Tax=Clostridium caldaquaticum TaxID=2940653 RepID=UPI002076E242|nr:helix-turn-helix domain-containing protein [Clostridium caldaquaticum]MCM8709978.1 helix-turn-helix domain-containing protein [Clostridium caldaquaticum]